MKKIILTGGGTAGHVIPNIALLDKLKENNYEIFYIGRKTGIEKDLIENNNIKYYGINCGKLRRYLDFKNITDIFKVLVGVTESYKIIKKIKPNIIFSKGGFVSVPVILAAKLCKVPVIIHESDITIGLSNKIAIPFAKIICYSFPETENLLPKDKSKFTGNIIREEIFKNKIYFEVDEVKFKFKKPIILVMGGSQGSIKINKYIRSILSKLIVKYNVIHICGKRNINKELDNIDSYKQFEYIDKNIYNIYKFSDIIISRAGSNSIYEILSLQKPNLLIPLPKSSSRGDQILNAKSFEKQGFSIVLEEDKLEEDILLKKIEILYNNKNYYIDNMKKSKLSNGLYKVLKYILEYTN